MDSQTIDTYNKLAQEYDLETVDFWQGFPKSFFDMFIEKSGKRILNIGSGPGRDGLVLKSAGKDVVCLDASEEMVKMSAERGLESVVGNFNDLPFSKESFDAVWSYTALLHIPKDSIAIPLAQISSVLKPGGIFGLGLIEGDTEGYRESSGVHLPRWFSYYEKNEIENLVLKQGFNLLYFESFKPGSRKYLNFIFRKR